MDTPEDAAPVTEAAAEEWSPPRLAEKTGVALYDEFPANHRLRAEALVAAGKDKDPAGLITPELIADTAKRLDSTKAASPLSLSVPKLTKALDRIDDPAELTRLRAEEANGENRQGALDAIDARATALATPTN